MKQNTNIQQESKQVSSHTPETSEFIRKVVDYVVEKVDEQFDTEIPRLKAENEKLKADKAVLLEALNNLFKSACDVYYHNNSNSEVPKVELEIKMGEDISKAKKILSL